jgi:hypothetical protein
MPFSSTQQQRSSTYHDGSKTCDHNPNKSGAISPQVKVYFTPLMGWNTSPQTYKIDFFTFSKTGQVTYDVVLDRGFL